MTHQRLKDFAQSKSFHHAINYAIISFAVVIGLETILKEPEWQAAFRVLDFIYVVFFSIEIVIRILAEDHPGLFFVLFTLKRETIGGIKRTRFEFTEHGFWNYFDFILIFFSVLGLFAHLFTHPTFIQIGRLFRIFRIIRLLEISEHLKEVERRIMSIIPTVFSFVLLLLILNYIYAVFGMFIFDGWVSETCNFSTIVDSFVTLFQVMTLDNWSDVMKDVQDHTGFNSFFIQMYFVTFVLFTSIIAFNVFIAVMTSQVADKVQEDVDLKVAESQELDEGIHEGLRVDMREIMKELKLVKQELVELRKK